MSRYGSGAKAPHATHRHGHAGGRWCSSTLASSTESLLEPCLPSTTGSSTRSLIGCSPPMRTSKCGGGTRAFSLLARRSADRSRICCTRCALNTKARVERLEACIDQHALMASGTETITPACKSGSLGVGQWRITRPCAL